ncbi:hypothetical protein ACFL0G_05650 [Candidatus Zixiibacteriota bacterium]
MRGTACVVLLLLVLLSTAALAEVPGLMNYHGTLTDSGGVVLDTTVAMTFSIYNDSLGGSTVWTETQPWVEVSAGAFNVLLGSVNSIPDTVFNAPGRWLGVQVGGDPEMTPRRQITAVGYAFRSAESDTAGYAHSAGGGGGGDDGDWTISGDDMYAGIAGRVGIGTTVPGRKLDVKGSVSGSDTTVGSYGILADSTFGVSGYCFAGNAVVGQSYYGAGVAGYSNSGAGVYGWSSTDNAGHFDGNVRMTGFEMPTGATNGYVLTSDGSGLGTWLAPAAGSDGDWTISGDHIYSAVPGSVGIGTTSPAADLHIASQGNPELRLDNDDWKSTLSFYQSSNIRGYLMKDDDDGRLILSANGSSDHVNILESSGNVGIGTLSPATRLDVNGVVTATDGNSNQWNTAHSWGDHALENYLKLNATNSSSSITTLNSTSVTNLLNISGSTSYAALYLINNYAGNNYSISAGCGSSSAGSLSYGLYGYNYGTGFGTYGKSYNASGTGVRGINVSSGTIGDLGGPSLGVYGEYDGDTYGYLGSSDYGAFGQYQAGVYGMLGHPSGGVVGQRTSNNRGTLGYTQTDANFFYHFELAANGDGQSAAYAYRTRDTHNDGTGYGVSTSNTAFSGYSYNGDSYSFGTAGHNFNDYTRCGGVLGADHSASYWGSLGYKNSGSSAYGGYFTSYTSGTGKGDQAALGIGLGAWGDLFGADIHGKVYGAYVEGGSYGLYSHGAVFMDDLNVHLQHSDDNATSVLYANVSTDVTVQTSGFASLSDGKSSIAFDQSFRGAVSPEVPIVVTVTPTGPCQGVYVSRVTGDGFTVVENNAGKSSVQVAFIAVGRRAGYENPRLPAEVVSADYVNKISRGLHNDADTATDGQGLYFENGELVVGTHPSTLPDPNKPAEEIEQIEQVQHPRPRVLPEELSDNNGKAPERDNRVMEER